MFHDPYTGETYAPIQHLPAANASFEVYNSPLSEYAALGFEYGYSVAAPDALVLWEAQFGDFVNGAQIVIDQFLVAGRSKWGQTSRLTLLLPHGYEGNGPEHSSARLERFLQQGAQDNIRIANCTTAAQFFHLLRRQALDATARPLVVMTPKGLLRLKQRGVDARGALDRLVPARDPRPDRRLATCAGSFSAAGRSTTTSSVTTRGRARRDVAVARLEQLYPFPVEAVAELIASLPNLEEIVWAQEEPQNMGAWRSIRHRLDDAARSSSSVAGVTYVGRTVARLAERGLPDRAPDRAGPHRPGRARRRPCGLISACVERWPRRRPLPQPSGRASAPRGHLGAVGACRIEQQAALCGCQLAPQAVGERGLQPRVLGAAAEASPTW